MVNKIKAIIARARTIRETQGWYALLKSSLVYIQQRVYDANDWYLFENIIKDHYEFNLQLKGNIKDYLFHNSREADAMAELIGVDFRDHVVEARRALDNGAVALVLYSGDKVAHIGLIATTQKAKDSYCSFPYPVCFDGHQACSGTAYTVPEFRGQGLMQYGVYKKLQWLKSQGIVKTYNSIRCNNVASMNAYAHFGPKIVGKVRHIRFLWWESYREKKT